MAKALWPAKLRAVASSALGFCALSLTNQDSLCIRSLPSSQQSCKKLRKWGLPHMLCLGDKGSLEGGGALSLLVQLQGLLGSVPLADPVPTVSPWGLGPAPPSQGTG